MADSPFVAIPLDPTERPILDNLLSIRTQLELLKQDKSTYVKSHDVIELYNKVIEQVDILNEIRIDKRLEQNRVDTVLDDCFQLISLSFLTIGKINDPPAIYAALSTMKRLLDHLKEAAFFSPKDISSIGHRLEDYRESIARGKETYSPALITLLEARVEVCQTTLTELEQSLSRLTPALTPKYEKLVSILRSLSACYTKSTFPTNEVKDLVKQLKDIEAPDPEEKRNYEQMYHDILEMMKTRKTEAPEAEALVKDLENRCFLWSEIMLQRKGKMDEKFEDLYKRLKTIRDKLQNLTLTHSWSLRETDLYAFQRQLDRIDEARVDGNFLDAEGNPAELPVQRTLLYLLRKSYALIYQLIISSEPVSEALLPIYNQLLTLRRCLIEVKKSGGVSDPREVYPYSMKLNSIDNMRTDGKFMVGNDIPDGQGNVSHLLAECFELAYELRTQAEEEAEDAEEASDALATPDEAIAV